MLCCYFIGVVVFGIADVELLLSSLLATSGNVLVLKPHFLAYSQKKN
jgi:hypothetical protein